MARFPTPLFEVPTPLGFVVRTTPAYWAVLQHKHPEIQGKLDEVQYCLAAPQHVRHSKHDPAIFLFYAPSPPYHLCVVVKRLNQKGFIVTCYITDAIKEGATIWPTSE